MSDGESKPCFCAHAKMPLHGMRAAAECHFLFYNLHVRARARKRVDDTLLTTHACAHVGKLIKGQKLHCICTLLLTLYKVYTTRSNSMPTLNYDQALQWDK